MKAAGAIRVVALALLVARTSGAEPAEPGRLTGLWRMTNPPAGMAWVVGTTNVPGAVRVCSVVQPGVAGAGLVPLFVVERQRMGILRRLPPKGLEQQFDPIAFVLPLETEPAVGAVSGRWRVVSKKDDGSVHRLTWELAAAGKVVSGRFDPDTDYRFAHITDGTLIEDRLEFRVEYIEDRYQVTGVAGGDGWSGTWQRPDGSEKGQWSATRALPEKPASLPSRAVALWEWRKSGSPEVWYGVEGQVPEGTGWKRNDPALGRVWAP